MYENPWLYQGVPFDDSQVGSNIGFVYLITDLTTSKRYIGKKIFNLRVVKKPLKGKTRRRISQKSSGWQDYYGSNETLKNLVAAGNKNDYKREILHLCISKSAMSYLETKEILTRDVLISDGWYNDWVSCKMARGQLNGFRISQS